MPPSGGFGTQATCLKACNRSPAVTCANVASSTISWCYHRELLRRLLACMFLKFYEPTTLPLQPVVGCISHRLTIDNTARLWVSHDVNASLASATLAPLSFGPESCV